VYRDERARVAPWHRALAALAVGVVLLVVAARAPADDECLLKVKAARVTVGDNDTVCGEAQNKTCVFQLQLCLDQASASCTAAPLKRKVKAKGRCAGVGKLRVKPDGTSPVCGEVTTLKVKTKKKGTREGACKITVATKSTDKPARKDVEKLTLVCKPTPGDCPVKTGPSTTTTTLPCLPACDCCVRPATDLLRCVTL
jgi:hypothetical protein